MKFGKKKLLILGDYAIRKESYNIFCVQGVGVGIVRGTGKQATGTMIVFIAWYIFAWPIGIPLLFATKLGMFGLWCGYDIGIVVEDLIIAVFVFTLNWKKEAEKVLKHCAFLCYCLTLIILFHNYNFSLRSSPLSLLLVKP